MRYAIAEDIMRPPDGAGLWVDKERVAQQPLIVAVARPEHNSMLTETDWAPVRISSDVPHAEDWHEERF